MPPLPRSLIVAVTLAAAVSPACSRQPAKAQAGTGGYHVGVTLLTKTHPFYKELEDGLREAAGGANVELRVQSAEFDTATQTAQIENFVAQKLDAIVVCPVDSDALGGALGRAQQAHVPIFTADIRSHQGEVVSHIASDNQQGGALVGDYLARALKGTGKVAIIDQPVVASVQERVRGFEQALGKYPGIHIVAKLSGGGVRDQAATTMENLLQAHPDLNAVFGINDNSALGALSVLRSRGRTDVRVVGFDADPEGRQAIRSGFLLADAVQDPRKIGRTTIETVVAYLKGAKVPKEVTIPTGLVDRATLDSH